MDKQALKNKPLPDQPQPMPGEQSQMEPQPEVIRESYQGVGKLKNKIALITGGDSGIGRSIAVHYAREGAKIAIVYLNEDNDAQDTQKMVEQEGSESLLIKGDITDKDFSEQVVHQTIEHFGGLNILINNAAEQHPHSNPEEQDLEITERTFKTNIFAMFYITVPALKHLKAGDVIINTTSITAYKGRSDLIDYSSTKGAISSFTYALSQALAERSIRVNAVAPGPIWTPLIPSTFSPEKVRDFGKNTPLGRPGQPSEVAPAYVFLASEDASYITGQVIHVNGGEIVRG